VTAARDARAAVIELSTALRVVHLRLLATVRKSFEKLHGRVEGPGALLQLVVDDPLFAWLRPLSQRIAALDELATGPVDPASGEAARTAVAELLEEESFRAHYLVYLQSDPDVVVAHASLRGLIAQRPRR
jgi:hypothetical protein